MDDNHDYTSILESALFWRDAAIAKGDLEQAEYWQNFLTDQLRFGLTDPDSDSLLDSVIRGKAIFEAGAFQNEMPDDLPDEDDSEENLDSGLYDGDDDDLQDDLDEIDELFDLAEDLGLDPDDYPTKEDLLDAIEELEDGICDDSAEFTISVNIPETDFDDEYIDQEEALRRELEAKTLIYMQYSKTAPKIFHKHWQDQPFENIAMHAGSSDQTAYIPVEAFMMLYKKLPTLIATDAYYLFLQPQKRLIAELKKNWPELLEIFCDPKNDWSKVYALSSLAFDLSYYHDEAELSMDLFDVLLWLKTDEDTSECISEAVEEYAEEIMNDQIASILGKPDLINRFKEACRKSGLSKSEPKLYKSVSAKLARSLK